MTRPMIAIIAEDITLNRIPGCVIPFHVVNAKTYEPITIATRKMIPLVK